MAMSFERFQQSRRDSTNLAADMPDCAECFEHYASPPSEAIYAGGLYIERCADGWMLTIGNSSRQSKSLVELESDLYEYAVSEGWVQ